MECVKCGKKAQITVQNIHTCKHCFKEIIEKRVRKEIRTKNLIEKNDHILIVNDDTAETKLNKYLLPRILKDLPVKIEEREQSYEIGDKIEGNYDKVIIPWNADMEGELFLKSVFENEKGFLGHFSLGNKRYIKLLLPITQEEVETLADIRGFKYVGRPDTDISKMLDQLEEEYPEIKFALLKSSEALKQKFYK